MKQQGKYWAATLVYIATTTAAAQTSVSTPIPTKNYHAMRAFNEADYALAFDILVKAGDNQSAFLVAQKAVAAQPDDKVWRMRLIQISQWTNHREVFSEQWLYLFENGERSSEAIQQVIDVAPFAGKPLVALKAWALYAQHNKLTEPQWRDIYNLYEIAAEPIQGSEFFENEYKRTPQPLLLELAATLAENGGDDDRAERLYVQLARLKPFAQNHVLHTVHLLSRRGKLELARDIMQEHEAAVPDTEVAYWELLGQIAWTLGDENTARSSFEHYVRLPKAQESDWEKLIFLVRKKSPEQAAQLSIEAWRKFGNIDYFLQGFSIMSELGDLPVQTHLLTLLTEKDRETLEKNVQFLLLRIYYYQRMRNRDAAWVDIQAVLKLEPQNVEAISSGLWHLTDTGRTKELKRFLLKYNNLALKQTPLWSGYAAACQLLEEHRQAVYWYQKIVNANADDPLTLLNYADALARINRGGMAERIRRHAWLQLKKRYPNPAAALKPHESNELLALARMMILNNPGDPGMELVRRLVSHLRGIPAIERDAQTQALILGWAIAKEQYPNARTWMWTNYVRHAHQAPLWGDSQTALQLKETQVLDKLLTHQSNALPLYNRYDISYELGHVQQALDIAFKGQVLQDDEPMYERFRLHAPLHAHYIQLESQSEQQAGLSTQFHQLEARWVVNPQLHLLLGSKGQRQTPSDNIMGEITPEWSQLTNIEARWFRARSQTSLALSDTDNGAAHFWGVRLKHNYQWSGHSSIDGYLSYRTESTITPAMRVAGYENGIGIGANFTLSKREYMRIGLRYADYFSQSGEALGNGRFVDVEAGHRLRLDYPDWRISAYARWQDYNAFPSSNNVLDTPDPQQPQPEPQPEPQAIDPPVSPDSPQNPIEPRRAVARNIGNKDQRRRDFFDPFIPRSSITTGVCLGMGENLGGQNMQETYSRAWRYFGNVCVNQDSMAGSTVNGTLGVAGSIMGNDHLRVQFQSGNSMLPGNAATQSLSVRYRYYF